MLGFGKTKKELVRANEKLQQFEFMTLALQSQVDILEFRVNDRRKYLTKTEQVNELKRKYKCQSEYGNQITQRILNLRVAFSMPNRLFLMPNSTKQEEMKEQQLKDCKKFLTDFMTINNLDGSMPRDLAKEAELRGEVLLHLKWDESIKNVRLYYYPCDAIGYKVENEVDYQLNGKKKLTYNDVTGKEVTVKDDNFVFIAFNDELNDFVGYPTLGGILEILENIDKDLIDWRRLNHLFAHPTPHFKCETQDDADAVNALIRQLGWKVGTAIATNSEFNLKGTTGVEANLLMLSITTNAKIISGHTGIAIHFLGFANVMNNRSTADDMGEPTEVVLHSEITSWNTFYNDLFKKVIRMRNDKLQGELPEDYVIPKIIPLTDKQYELIKELYLPLAEAKKISDKTLLEQIPGLDVEEEMRRVQEAFDEAAKNAPEEDPNKEETDEGDEESDENMDDK